MPTIDDLKSNEFRFVGTSSNSSSAGELLVHRLDPARASRSATGRPRSSRRPSSRSSTRSSGRSSPATSPEPCSGRPDCSGSSSTARSCCSSTSCSTDSSIDDWWVAIFASLFITAITVILSSVLSLDDDAVWQRTDDAANGRPPRTADADRRARACCSCRSTDSPNPCCGGRSRRAACRRWPAGYAAAPIRSPDGSATCRRRPARARPASSTATTTTCRRSAGTTRSSARCSRRTGRGMRPSSSTASPTATGLLVDGGVSRSNVFSGDSNDSILTFSTVTDRSKHSKHTTNYVLSDPYAVSRLLALTVADVVREIIDRRRHPQGQDRAAPQARRDLPGAARRDDDDPARPHAVHADERRVPRGARGLRRLRRVRRGRPPLGHLRVDGARHPRPPRPATRPPRAGDRRSATAVPRRRAVRPRPDAGSDVPPALRRHARAGRVVAHRRAARRRGSAR